MRITGFVCLKLLVPGGQLVAVTRYGRMTTSQDTITRVEQTKSEIQNRQDTAKGKRGDFGCLKLCLYGIRELA